jgi:ABC-type lipoprotein release transport system permease subunit
MVSGHPGLMKGAKVIAPPNFTRPRQFHLALAMALLGLVGTWIPARRALTVDPMILLREE